MKTVKYQLYSEIWGQIGIRVREKWLSIPLGDITTRVRWRVGERVQSRVWQVYLEGARPRIWG